MTQPLRYSTHADGPLTVELKDGGCLKAAYLDGGGIEVTAKDAVYEVHGAYLDGGFLCICQDKIERVVTVKGEEVEFGSPYYPGHPRPVDNE